MADRINQEETVACPSRLVTDEPSTRDELGSHTRVAKVLANIFCNEEGGRSVALVGDYGSGKSTVVKLLAERFKGESNRVALFTFDAWAHQGDPLRRSFLLELYQYLEQHSWIREGDFKRQIDELNSRHETATSKTEADVTWWGLAVVASIPFAAFAATWIEQFWWARFGVAAPLLIAVLGAVVGLFRRTEKPRTPTQLYELFRKEPREIVHMATIRTPDPTSVEFRDYFDHVVERVLSDTDDRLLIIVLDNLDRLDRDEALALFATMRTFFDPSSPHSRRELKMTRKLWLVVPFDPSWLPSSTASATDKIISHDEAVAFFQKAFQITVKVPRPILTSWRSYLREQLALALPGHTGDFETIYLLYQRANEGKSGQQITPRAIKQFVNGLVMSHLLHCDEVPISTQAAYVLFVLNDRDAIVKLRKSELVDIETVSLLHDPEWQSGIACIYYNLPPRDARQVLFQEPIIEAIDNATADPIANIATLPGFREAFIKVISDNMEAWLKSSTAHIAQACYVLAAIGRLEEDTSAQILRDGFLRVSKWEITERHQIEGLLRLFEIHPDQSESNLSRLLNRLAPPSEEDNVDGWLRVVSQVTEWALNRSSSHVVIDQLRMPKQLNLYVVVLEKARKYDDAIHLHDVLRPRFDPKDVLPVVRDRLQNATDLGGATLVRDLARVPAAWPMDEVVKVLNSLLRSGEAYDASRTMSYFDLLCFLAYEHKNKLARSTIEDLASSGNLLHHMAALDKDSSEFGRLLAPYFLYENGSIINEGQGGLNKVNEFITGVSNSKAALAISGLLSVATESDQLQRVFERLFEKKEWRPVAPVLFDAGRSGGGLLSDQLRSILIKHYSDLAAPQPPEWRVEILKQATAAQAFDDTLTGDGFLIERLPLYTDRLGSALIEPARALYDMLLNGTGSVDKATWSKELSAPGQLSQLVLALLERKNSEWITDELRDAIDLFGQALLSTERASETTKLVLPKLLQALESSRRLVLLRSIADRMQTGPMDDIIACFGSALLASAILADSRDHADRFARHVLSRLLNIDQPNTDHIAWAIRVVQTGDFVRLLPEETGLDLARRVKTLYDNSNIPETIREGLQQALVLLPKTEEKGLEASQSTE